MHVVLRELKPNPWRNFAVDPMDEEAIVRLTTSIQEHGFWGGVVCRINGDGEYEIACGHHRVEAAIRAGIESADLFVGEFNDASMIQVYALENATQRGASSTASTGSVAAAVRYIAKGVLTGGLSEFRQSTPELAGNMGSSKGVGWKSVLAVLDGVPGINKNAVDQALANLKSSGEYAAIIEAVEAEIEREQREAEAALAKAEEERSAAEEAAKKAEAERKAAEAKAKAANEEAERKRAELDRQRAEVEAKLAEKRRAEAEEARKQFAAMKQSKDDAVTSARKAVASASKEEVVFDFKGVSKYLKNPHQVDVFRDVVTGDGVRPYLDVSRQSELAKHLVDYVEVKRREAIEAVEKARKEGKKVRTPKVELTGEFIRTHLVSLVLDPKRFEQKAAREDKQRLLEEDLAAQAQEHQRAFAWAYRSMLTAATKLDAVYRKWPKNQPFPTLGEFTRALIDGKAKFDELNERY